MDIDQQKKMAVECIALINKKLSREMTPNEYYIALIGLHKKYPLNCDPNFYSAAQMYSKKILNAEILNVKVNDGSSFESERIERAS